MKFVNGLVVNKANVLHLLAHQWLLLKSLSIEDPSFVSVHFRFPTFWSTSHWSATTGPWRVRYRAIYFSRLIILEYNLTLNAIAFGHFMKKRFDYTSFNILR